MKLIIYFVMCALVLFGNPSVAKDYPTQPVTLVVPFTAGGPNDTVARHLSNTMSQYLGQAVIVDNRPSVGGIIGTDSVVRANTNGYTLLAQSFTLATMSASGDQLPFDPLKDLDYVGEFAKMPMVLVGSSKFQPNTLREINRLAKKKPQAINMATSGNGSPSYLCSALIQDTMKVSFTNVPYKGNAPALVDVQNGNVDLICAQVSVVMPLILADKVKVYGVTTRRRIAQLPTVPTFAEQGYENFDLTMWHGVFAPKNTPPAITAKLVQALQSTVEDSQFKEKIQEAGGIAADRAQATPRQLEANFKFEAKRWIPILKRQSKENQ